MAAPTNAVSLLRAIGHVEAISFLILLFIAMPLKYLAGMPMAVKVAGWIHGMLFMALIVALVRAKLAARWPVSRAGLVLVAALLPFGPFMIDRRMREYEGQYQTAV
jgi:integral membrane protein